MHIYNLNEIFFIKKKQRQTFRRNQSQLNKGFENLLE